MKQRLPGLDGLRVIAVALVILYHQGVLPFGWAGVQIFFVLSGYLITQILWRSREQPLRTYLGSFYARRTLRIFPLYYGALIGLVLLAFATGKGQVLKPSLPWLATYTYNLWSATAAFRESRYFSHFWSLCVEEQFYLLWPLLIFFVSRRAIQPVLLALFLAGPLIRLLEVLLLRSWPGANPLTDLCVYVLTPTYFDAFAIGALVGLHPLGGRRAALLASATILVIAVWIVFHTASGLRDTSGFGPGGVLIWGYGLVNLFAALLIDCLVFRKLLPGFFDSRPMRYLGSISYGLYVFHLPVQTVLEQKLPDAGAGPRLLLQLVLTVAISALSFRFFEQPFLQLKERFGRDRLPDT